MRTPRARRHIWPRRSPAVLAEALKLRPRAGLVVSGGNTPHPMYSKLAQHPLDWSRVYITLTDERWVATDDPGQQRGPGEIIAHARLRLRRAFRWLEKRGSPAHRRVPLRPGRRSMRCPDRLTPCCSAWGPMGTWPHCFPAALNCSGLDPQAIPACVAVQPPAASHPRLSLNLAALLQSRHIFVQIIGAGEMARTYEKARRLQGSTAAVPCPPARHLAAGIGWAPRWSVLTGVPTRARPGKAVGAAAEPACGTADALAAGVAVRQNPERPARPLRDGEGARGKRARHRFGAQRIHTMPKAIRLYEHGGATD